jgi:2-polyprenyl-3-methyl-5-hydroxy-6-metoxy-1,4-benzoquinol methylase
MINTKNTGEFTTQNYWENYYEKSAIEVKQVNAICGMYDPLWDKLVNENKSTAKSKTLIEVGAYPGRYLAYLSKKFNLIPTALDYNSDKSKIEETFKKFNITEFEILIADFIKYTNEKKYDIVISNGFIEHFEDYHSIVKKHSELLKEGGTMLIMVPNKRYVRKWFDWLCDYDNLKIHNTKCMSKNEFKNFASDNNLKVIAIGYFGSFAYNVHQSLNLAQNFIYQSTRFFFRKVNPYISKNPNKYFSSVLYGIYKK